jgi:hypothetical protein
LKNFNELARVKTFKFKFNDLTTSTIGFEMLVIGKLMFSKEHNAFKLAKIYTPGYKRERER